MDDVFTFRTVLDWIGILVIFSIMSAISNYIGYRHPINDSIIGMFILCGISLIGLVVEKIIPYDIPSILYISMLGLLLALPLSPVSPFLIEYTSKVELSSITTIILAYAGIAMGKDLSDFKEVGLRGILVTFMVLFGTYICSAVIAQGVLTSSGII